jgi:hypothetical protein
MKIFIPILCLILVSCGSESKPEKQPKTETESKSEIDIQDKPDNNPTTSEPKTATNKNATAIAEGYCDCFTKSAGDLNLKDIKLSQITNAKFQKQMDDFGNNMELCAETLKKKYGNIDKSQQEEINNALEENCEIMKSLKSFLEK